MAVGYQLPDSHFFAEEKRKLLKKFIKSVDFLFYVW